MRRDVIQPVSVVAIDPNDPVIAIFAPRVCPTVAAPCARRRFLRRLGIARITPKELTAGENISIVDLGQPMDIEAFPQIR
jgi:hypothetical protein